MLEEARQMIELQHHLYQDKLCEAEIVIHKLQSLTGHKHAVDAVALIASWHHKSGNPDMVSFQAVRFHCVLIPVSGIQYAE